MSLEYKAFNCSNCGAPTNKFGECSHCGSVSGYQITGTNYEIKPVKVITLNEEMIFQEIQIFALQEK